jgi:hypothetical protein
MKNGMSSLKERKSLLFEKSRVLKREYCKSLYLNQPGLLAPHTSGPRDVPRCGVLSLLQKSLHYRGVSGNRSYAER